MISSVFPMFVLRSQFTNDPGDEVCHPGIDAGPALHAAGRRSEGHDAHSGPPAGTVSEPFHRHERTSRVTPTRILAPLTARANLPVSERDAGVAVGLIALILVRQRQRQLQFHVGC